LFLTFNGIITLVFICPPPPPSSPESTSHDETIFDLSSNFHLFKGIRAYQQNKKEKLFKIAFAMSGLISLGIGIMVASAAMRYFNQSGVWVQTAIIAGIAIWRTAIVTNFLKIAFAASEKHGQKFDVMVVAFCIQFGKFFAVCSLLHPI
jgi:hypothetical protein